MVTKRTHINSRILFQLLQPTHDESVKDNDKIEGETLKKLIHHNFRSKTLVPVKTDYEADNIKVVCAISNLNYYSAQDVIKNIESIMNYNNVINPVYLIHGTHVAIKLNTQTDITECRESITELVLNNTDKDFFDAQGAKIRAAILAELRTNHKTSTSRDNPVGSKADQVGQSAKKQQ
ncbi:hypothetical protein ACTFIR_003884 [Dictyostelium discoideum]